MAVFGIGTKGVNIATARKAAKHFGAASLKKLLRATVMLLLL
jgi:hypothetical protein